MTKENKKNVLKKTESILFLLTILVIVILSINLVISQSDDNKLDDSDTLETVNNPQDIEKFETAAPVDKQKLWDKSSDSETKNKVLTKLHNDLGKKSWSGDVIAKGAVVLGEAGFDNFMRMLKDKGIKELDFKKFGAKFEVDVTSAQDLMDVLKKQFDIDENSDEFNYLVREFKGFEDSKLKWAELPAKNGEERNVIGDGKVWLDLGKIPLGTKVVEYSDSKFILHMYNGGKMIISGKTDNEGNIIFENVKFSDKDGNTETLKVSPFDISLRLVDGNEGTVEITNQGLKISGDAEVMIRGYRFTSADGKEGVVIFDRDYFRLTNTRITKDNVIWAESRDGKELIFKEINPKWLFPKQVLEGTFEDIRRINTLKQGLELDSVTQTTDNYLSREKLIDMLTDVRYQDKNVNDFKAKVGEFFLDSEGELKDITIKEFESFLTKEKDNYPELVEKLQGILDDPKNSDRLILDGTQEIHKMAVFDALYESKTEGSHFEATGEIQDKLLDRYNEGSKISKESFNEFLTTLEKDDKYKLIVAQIRSEMSSYDLGEKYVSGEHIIMRLGKYGSDPEYKKVLGIIVEQMKNYDGGIDGVFLETDIDNIFQKAKTQLVSDRLAEELSIDNPLESVVRFAGFEDMKNKRVMSSYNPATGPIYKNQLSGNGNINLEFDSSGKLVGISNSQINEGKLFRMSDSNIKQLYDHSSDFVKGLIDRAKKGEHITYSDIRQGFYLDKDLKAKGREISIGALQDNFVIVSGENVYVGGEGDAGILKNMNSVTSIDGDAFRLYSKDVRLFLDGDKLISNTMSHLGNKMGGLKNAFTINDITLIKDGRAAKNSFQLVQVGKDKLFKTVKSDTLIAGRQTFSGPFGLSTDLYLELDKKDYDARVKDSIKGWIPGVNSNPGENFIDAMIRSNYALRNDIYMPEIEGVRITNTQEFVEEQILSSLDDVVEERVINLLSEDQIKDLEPEMRVVLQGRLKEQTITSIKQLVSDSVEGIGDVGLGTVSIELRNDPNPVFKERKPTIIITLPNGQNLPDIKPTGNEATLINLVLEGALHIPDLSRTKHPTRDYIIGYPRIYWPSELLKNLWYQNLGQETRFIGKKSERFLLKTAPEILLKKEKN